MSDASREGEFIAGVNGLGGQDTEALAVKQEPCTAEVIAAKQVQARAEFSDHALVQFVGLFGAVGIEHVMSRFAVGRTAAYRRVAACVEGGLLERLALLREEPVLLRATAAGLRWVGLDYPVVKVSPGSVRHLLRCAFVGVCFGHLYGMQYVVTEREIRRAEREEGRPLFSAKVGENPDGSPLLHRPDLGLLHDERPVCVEIELSAKSPARLAQIMKGWRRASWVGQVVYFCEPGAVERAVRQAIEKAHVGDRVLMADSEGMGS